MTNDLVNCSKCWMQLKKNHFENTIKVFLKGTKIVVEAEDRSDREGAIVYLGSISAK